MRKCHLTWSQAVENPMRFVAVTFLLATFMGGSALAQAPRPAPVPKAPPATSQATPAKPAVPATATLSASPIPTYDENTVQRISQAMLSYSVLEVQGGWPPLPASASKLAPGATGPDVAALRQRLGVTDDLAPEKIAGDAYDATLTVAVKHFQMRHGLPETGSIGPKTLTALNVPVSKRLRQLAASLDRLAAMDFTFGQRYVVVNLAAATAEAVEGDKVARRHTVQVGRADRPSPTLTTFITTVNLNPTWTVPLGILKKDVIPKMRKDPGYAGRMHMKVLDGAGHEVDPHAVDWNSDRAPNFTIRQDSGSWNALGSVRIDMPNPYSVYMHDTSHKNLFSNDYRFESSGCTRVAEVRDFAAWLLRDNPGWGRAEIDAGIEKGQRQDIRLTHKVPVAWTYLTGWATRDGTIHFRDDVYKHDEHGARPLVADLQRPVSVAARASGFVLQSADPVPAQVEVQQVSYLDSQ